MPVSFTVLAVLQEEEANKRRGDERRGAKNGGSTKLSVVSGGHIRSTWEGGALGGVEEGWSAIVEKRGPSKQDHADGLVVVGAQQSQGGGVLSPAFNHKEEV